MDLSAYGAKMDGFEWRISGLQLPLGRDLQGALGLDCSDLRPDDCQCRFIVSDSRSMPSWGRFKIREKSGHKPDGLASALCPRGRTSRGDVPHGTYSV